MSLSHEITIEIPLTSKKFRQAKLCKVDHSVPPPPGIRGRMIFVSSARQGATAKLQEPGWGHIQGGDDFRQSSRGRGGFFFLQARGATEPG